MYENMERKMDGVWLPEGGRVQEMERREAFVRSAFTVDVVWRRMTGWCWSDFKVGNLEEGLVGPGMEGLTYSGCRFWVMDRQA